MKLPSFILLFCLSICACVNAQPNNPAPYCDGSFDDGADPGNGIPAMPVPDAFLQVQLGSLNNNSNAQTGGNHYAYYSSMTAPALVRGTTYTLSVKLDLQGGCGAAAWIDYNQNFVFDANEKIWFNNSLPVGTTQTFTASVTIPTTAATGSTRFRVRLVEDDNYNMTNNYVIIPCNLSVTPTDVMDWGETEDYNVSIATTTGIESLHVSTIAIFPNPVKEVVTVQGASANSKVEICNVYGQVILSQELPEASSIDVSGLSAGVYLLHIVSADGHISASHKLIRE